MIIVSCATGNLGSLIIDKLLKTIPSSQIIALVRDERKAVSLKEKGVEIRKGDYTDISSLNKAFESIEKLMFISSGDFNKRIQQHKNVIDAAKNTGVKHIYYTGISIKDINTSPLKPFLEDHFQTEVYIKKSGISYSFLRNGLYYENLPMFLGEKVKETDVFFPAGDGKVAFVSREDLAEAATKIILSNNTQNKIYDLAGVESVSFQEIADSLGTNYLNPSNDDFTNALKSFDLPESTIQMSVAFAAGMKKNNFKNPGSDLKKILDRKVTTINDYLKTL